MYDSVTVGAFFADFFVLGVVGATEGEFAWRVAARRRQRSFRSVHFFFECVFLFAKRRNQFLRTK